MSDLEITKLCAEAMEFPEDTTWHPDNSGALPLQGENHYGDSFFRRGLYNPLHDDAQAMALVKRCDLNISRQQWSEGPAWYVTAQRAIGANKIDLNRAICECVANMQKAKHD